MYKQITLILAIIAFTYVNGFALGLVNPDFEAANNLAKKGIINDHSNEPLKYNTTDNVLRQEIAAIARGIAKLDKKNTCDDIFLDVTATIPNDWACKNIEVLVDNNLISKNTTFRPQDKITKSEAIAMLIKAIGFDYSYNPNSTGNWQQQVVNFAVQQGIVENFTDYDTQASRGWVFKLADTTIKKDEEIKMRINIENIYSDEIKIK